MNIIELKKYVLENEMVEDILSEIGCHSIVLHDGNPDDYLTCANKNGDNKSAITVYLNEYLVCVNYTRDISNGKDFSPDIFSLVNHCMDMSFFEAFKFVCGVVGLDVYHDFDRELPESAKIMKALIDMEQGHSDEDETPLRKISEKILTYYISCVNDMFKDDGISYDVQQLFEIGYDCMTNRITIPIRSEFGDLVGVKGRIFEEDYDGDLKYYYLEKCPRNKILYGLHFSEGWIEKKGVCFVGESEKSVLQLWSMGHKNCVGIGGKRVSKGQILKLERLGCDIVFVFDKDVEKEEIESLADKFMDGVNISAIYDEDNILGDHESPTDSHEKFEQLLKNNVYIIKGR